MEAELVRILGSKFEISPVEGCWPIRGENARPEKAKLILQAAELRPGGRESIRKELCKKKH